MAHPGRARALLGGALADPARGRTSRTRSSLVLWGGWLVVTGLAFSLGQGIIHPYYTVALGPAIGALVGIGAHTAWQHRPSLTARLFARRRVARHRVVGRPAPRSHADLAPDVADGRPRRRLRAGRRPSSCGTGSAGGRGGRGRGGHHRRAGRPGRLHLGDGDHAAQRGHPLGRPAGAGGLRGRGARGGGPAAAVSVAAAVRRAADRRAPAPGGPADRGGGPARGTAAGPASRSGGRRRRRTGRVGGFGGVRAGGGIGGILNGSTSSPELTAALRADADRYTGRRRWCRPTRRPATSWPASEPVMAIGGFNGTDPAPSLAEFQQDVADGRIHYFIAGGGGGGGGGAFGGGSGESVARRSPRGSSPTSRPPRSAGRPSTT